VPAHSSERIARAAASSSCPATACQQSRRGAPGEGRLHQGPCLRTPARGGSARSGERIGPRALAGGLSAGSAHHHHDRKGWAGQARTFCPTAAAALNSGPARCVSSPEWAVCFSILPRHRMAAVTAPKSSPARGVARWERACCTQHPASLPRGRSCCAEFGFCAWREELGDCLQHTQPCAPSSVCRRCSHLGPAAKELAGAPPPPIHAMHVIWHVISCKFVCNESRNTACNVTCKLDVITTVRVQFYVK
jgi:hypothetical protein